MSRRITREVSKLVALAPTGSCGAELSELAMFCSSVDDKGLSAEAFARAGGLGAIAAAVTASNGRNWPATHLLVNGEGYEDEVHALLHTCSLLLRKCHKQVLRMAVESPLVDALTIACGEAQHPRIGVVTAAADVVGTLASACDYNALRGVELGLLDSVLRSAKAITVRNERELMAMRVTNSERQETQSDVPASLVESNTQLDSPKKLKTLERAVKRALIASGLDVPRRPRGGKRGVRILSLDGGGTRALASLEVVREIERQTQRPICESFDLIGGTSSGGVLALALGLRQSSVTDCEDVYKAMASRIFSRATRVISAGRLLLLNKGQYNTKALESVLQEALGTSVLVETRLDMPNGPRVFVVSTMMSAPTAVPYLHANYRPPPRPPGSGEHRYRHGCHHTLWEAARASTAVPSYFDAFRSGEEVFCDGAILVNNPAAIAVHEARLLWPNAPLECIVSVGTGRPDISTKAGSENLYDVAKALINSATDTEAVHHALEDLAPEGVYYRFNPVIPIDIGSDETRKNVLEDVQKSARQYVLNNGEHFRELAVRLSQGYSNEEESTAVKKWWPRWSTRL
ncbi:hypothetical protein NDN08_006261 [Rhodosorus marinus]|uniref:PNPLA domain-containing protein n=1 Tax=Rhodosorus marinus TaxID=101924 RepID=A0AAV8UK74_9RHOD|nr:hypothetical protein NDN08_006261 [Rhodosorus marinus]